MVLLVERLCGAAPGVIGTVGRLETEPDGDDAIPSTCRFAVDVRAAVDADRAAVVAGIHEGFGEIARRRRVACWTAEGRSAGEVPCDAGLRDRLAAALAAEEGEPPRGGEIVGVAGRDAMAMARRCPSAMLLVRAKSGRRALRPADLVSVEDCAAALAAVEGFVRGFAPAKVEARA